MNRDLRLLAYELGRALGERRALPELIAFVVATCRDLLKAEGVAILLLDREQDELYFPFSAEEDPQVAARLSGIRFPAHQGIAGKVLRTARSLRVDDVSAERAFFAGVDRETQRTTRSLVCAPLISPHGAIGVIEAVNPRGAERFSDDDVALLDALAQTIASAIVQVQSRSQAPAEAAPVGEPSAATGGETPVTGRHVFRRQGEYWTISEGGETVRLRHTKGLSFIAHLLRHPGQDVHAIDLVNAVSGERDAPFAGRTETNETRQRSLGDAGEMLDSQARVEYRRRLDDLRGELAEAQTFSDTGRAEALQQEIDYLTQEIARAVGLGGRARRAGSHAERARVNVTRAIATALRKIGEHHTGLGRHFAAAIRTGTFCSYVPDPRAPTEWML